MIDINDIRNYECRRSVRFVNVEIIFQGNLQSEGKPDCLLQQSANSLKRLEICEAGQSFANCCVPPRFLQQAPVAVSSTPFLSAHLQASVTDRMAVIAIRVILRNCILRRLELSRLTLKKLSLLKVRWCGIRMDIFDMLSDDERVEQHQAVTCFI
jgi:hypothetical protein